MSTDWYSIWCQNLSLYRIKSVTYMFQICWIHTEEFCHLFVPNLLNLHKGILSLICSKSVEFIQRNSVTNKFLHFSIGWILLISYIWRFFICHSPSLFFKIHLWGFNLVNLLYFTQRNSVKKKFLKFSIWWILFILQIWRFCIWISPSLFLESLNLVHFIHFPSMPFFSLD